MKVLIAGISGKLGRMLAARLVLRGHDVLGLDRRPWPDAPPEVEMHRVDVRKRGAEEVFRKSRPEAVIHMATVTYLSASAEQRYRINLNGTRAVFDYCTRHGVEHAVFVGRHTYYGAAADAPLYHSEADPPMAVSTYPELADLVAADLYAGTALWRFPDMTTSVLRVCYTLGPSRHGSLATFLRGPRVPMVLGFNPLFQFMHEHDVVSALCLTLEKRIKGVFNVAGPQPVPLSVLIEASGRSAVPIPEIALPWVLGRFGLPRLPADAIAHIKFPVVVDGSAFREATGFHHELDEARAMESFRWSGG